MAGNVTVLCLGNTQRRSDSLCVQAKKYYEKAFREAEKAQEAHKRAEQDINLSKADVEKVAYKVFVDGN